MTKRILITGAGGFVGRYLIAALQKHDNYEIFGSVYKSTSDLTPLLPPDHLLTGDLTQPAVATSHLQTAKPDLIYHLAALSVVHNSREQALPLLQGNTAISYNLLEAMRQSHPKTRLLAICSANEYGAVNDAELPIRESTPLRPLNPYAVSKVTQEMLALQYQRAYGLDIVVVRPFNHIGPGQTTDFVVPKLAQTVVKIERELAPPTLDLGSGGAIRDFTDVRDMVKIYLALASAGLPGEVYNAGTGVGHTIREVAEIFQQLATRPFKIVEKPELSRPADVPVLIADPTKLKELYPFVPTYSLQKSISDILEYERKNYGN